MTSGSSAGLAGPDGRRVQAEDTKTWTMNKYRVWYRRHFLFMMAVGAAWFFSDLPQNLAVVTEAAAGPIEEGVARFRTRRLCDRSPVVATTGWSGRRQSPVAIHGHFVL